MSNGKRVMFYVQHLLGVGHVYRATRIASALLAAGYDVLLVWGGTRIPGFQTGDVVIHHLTPVRSSDAGFSQLVHDDGTIFTEADQDTRAARLLELFHQTAPDVLITEAFPFGRRQMFFELLPLLDAATKRPDPPLMVSSIRDIMQEGRKEKRVRESCDLVSRYYDIVMVHGDPQMIRIEDTLQGVSEFADKVRYTGIVTPDEPSPSEGKVTQYDVVVSAGGGAFGRELLEAALLAHPKTKSCNGKWLVTAGSEFPENEFNKLAGMCPAHVELVRHIPNLMQVLAQSRISISHAGYNTVADILRARCRSILYPHTGGRETEQLRRAEIMDQKGISRLISPGELSPGYLAAVIDETATAGISNHTIDLEGAAGSVEVLSREIS